MSLSWLGWPNGILVVSYRSERVKTKVRVSQVKRFRLKRSRTFNWSAPHGPPCGALSQNGQEIYDEQRVFDRSTVIQLAIDARQQHCSGERKYNYQPFAEIEDNYKWDPSKFDELLLDYNLNDLSI